MPKIVEQEIEKKKKKKHSTNGDGPTPVESGSGEMLLAVAEIPQGGALDQPLTSLPAMPQIEAQIEKTIKYSLRQGTPEPALKMLEGFVQVQHMSGLALAKTLYEINRVWENFDTEEDFVDAVLRFTGKSKDTIRRSVQLWTYYAENSDFIGEELVEQLKKRPLTDQFAIAQFVAANGALDRKQLKKLAKATDTVGVRDTLAQIASGDEDEAGLSETVSNAFRMTCKRDGKIIARKGKKHEAFAQLLVKPGDAENDDLIAQALARLERAGVQFE